jgi:hypothetical protein
MANERTQLVYGVQGSIHISTKFLYVYPFCFSFEEKVVKGSINMHISFWLSVPLISS